jgi:hypothetical protein
LSLGLKLSYFFQFAIEGETSIYGYSGIGGYKIKDFVKQTRDDLHPTFA